MKLHVARARTWAVIGWLILVSSIITWHSISDYLTSRTVAHNADVAQATCQATDRLTAAIRVVLIDGIKSSRRAELVLPQFKPEYDQQIRQNQRYLTKLFVIETC